jgi:diguanylate cyclase (GGDEF)-like protein/PAS domain S-box-containing protein
MNDEINQLLHDLQVHQVELEMQNDELRKTQTELEAARARYFEIYELAPVGYMILSSNSIVQEANLTSATMLGINKSDLIKRRLTKFILEEDQDIFYLFNKELVNSGEPQDCELRLIKKDGTIVWIHLFAMVGQDINGQKIFRIVINNIEDRKRIEKALKESEEKFRSLYSNMSQGIAYCKVSTDQTGTPVDFVILDINQSFTALLSIERDMLIGKQISEIIPILDGLFEAYMMVVQTGESFNHEIGLAKIGKSFQIFAFRPKFQYIALLMSDITDRLTRDKEIEYVSYHDMLTGLYNRRFLEEEIKRMDTARNLPITIIMGDMNRLKLVNDIFGHKKGDEFICKTADAIKASCRPEDLVARWGGDEFMILLPKTSAEDALKIIDRILAACEGQMVNEIPLSIAFGIAAKITENESIEDILRDAENAMYKSKSKESIRNRKEIIDSLVKILFQKSPFEEKHAHRVSALCHKTAVALGYDPEKVNMITLAGLMHDIGKVAVSVQILENPSNLNDEEWLEVKKHSEIGHKVVGSAQEMAEIGAAILAHHERLDGNGYPFGSKLQDIPVAARIICIADSFDTMTNPSTYHKRMTIQEAVEEIRKNEKAQFDPEIAEIFIKQLNMPPT